VQVLAPAKLNLFLEVLGKRPDGYHELDTVMVLTDWYDALTLREETPGRITFACDDPSLPTGMENLVVQAAERMRSELGISGERGAHIELRKTIPAQAGLAGGSSDAAGALLGLNELWGLGLSRERLGRIAASIGSDVPFFCHQVPAARCRGRGERVDAIQMRGSFHGVVVCPRQGIRTSESYARVELAAEPRAITATLEAIESGDATALGRSLFNRLQAAGEKLVPDLCGVRDALSRSDLGILGIVMSGSGSAYFGLTQSREEADHAASTLGHLGLGRVQAVTCKP
jgi:4-diphosphocytidyl-2-C-methyl-D-erythritol kinase